MPRVIGFDEAVTKKATCRHCGAINKYVPNEVRVLYKGRDISGCVEITNGFNCGNCGHDVITEPY